MLHPPNPQVKCAQCLYSIGFGYSRISRLLFGTDIHRHKIYDWRKYHGWLRPFDSHDSYLKILRKNSQPKKLTTLSTEEHDARRNVRFQKKTRKELRTYLQTSIWYFLKHNRHAKHVPRLIGCSRDELMAHLESKFSPEMSWENYGSFWEIDHIVPVSRFDIFTHSGRLQCYHFSNLQPLSGHDNRVKHTKVRCV